MVTWFEIPVTNMERAKTFYEAVFKINIKVDDFGGTLMGWFPYLDGKHGAPGSLILNEAYIPSDTHGALVYLNTNNIPETLQRVETEGGTIIQPETLISSETGHMALFKDSEGNRVALFAKPIN